MRVENSIHHKQNPGFKAIIITEPVMAALIDKGKAGEKLLSFVERQAKIEQFNPTKIVIDFFKKRDVYGKVIKDDAIGISLIAPNGNRFMRFESHLNDLKSGKMPFFKKQLVELIRKAGETTDVFGGIYKEAHTVHTGNYEKLRTNMSRTSNNFLNLHNDKSSLGKDYPEAAESLLDKIVAYGKSIIKERTAIAELEPKISQMNKYKS